MNAGARTQKRLTIATVLCACFAVNLFATLILRRASGGIDALWTANAFMMAAFVFLPRTWAAACAVGCAALQVYSTVLFGRDFPQATTYALLNIGEAAMAGYLIQRWRLERLTTPGRVVSLICLAILPTLIVFCLAGAVAANILIGRDVLEAFFSRIPAKILGTTIALPAILLLAKRKSLPMTLGRRAEAAGHFVGLAALCAAAFMGLGHYALFLMFPAVTALGLRLGPRAVTLAILQICAVLFPVAILWAPGKIFGATWPLSQQILMLQMFAATVLVTGLAAALGAKHQHRLRSLFAKRSDSATRARDRAQAANIAKSDFLATMSHEIRTPLNSILGFAQVLNRRGDLPAEAVHHIALIDRSGAALLTVVNDILDFSKVEAGCLELDPKPVRLKDVADDALAIVAETAASKGLTLTMTTRGADTAVHVVDDHRLRQILLNFLNNAVKFTDAGGIELSLTVTPGKDRDFVRAAVTDTGAGIADDARERLFQRFSQVDGSISRSHGGTGLGLAICRGLADLMGGRIGVDSVVGAGSTFWLEVELERAEAIADAAASKKAAASLAAHVLLVDDHPVNRELGAAVLALLGCTCDFAQDGREAVEAVQVRRYDAVLMDVHMPGMDGLAATRAIRRLGGPASHVPIIAMSADVLPEHVERARAAGMVDSVGKPIDVETLRACLARWIGRNADGERRAA